MSRFWLCALVLATAVHAQDEDRTMRVYSVNGLVPRLGRDLERVEDGRFAPLGAPDPHGSEPEVEEEPPSVNANAVAELITEVARDVDVRQVAGGRALLVYGTAAQHERIAKLLDVLHTQCGTPFEIEVRYLSVPTTALDGALRTRLASGAATADDWKRLAAADAERGARGGVVSVPHGQWSVYRATRRMHYMPDFEVEIAQGASVADPRIQMVEEGVRAAMQPLLLQDGGVLLHVVASAGELNDLKSFRVAAAPGTTLPDKPMSHDFGDLQQADYNGCLATTSLVLRAGGGVRALVLGAPGEERWEILAFGVRRAPKPAAAGTFTILPVGALTAPAGAFYGTFGYENDQLDAFLRVSLDEEAPRFVQPDAVEEILQEGMEARGQKGFLYDAPWMHGGSFLVRSGANEARMLQATVGALERAFVRPARVRVVFVTGDAEPDLAAIVGVVDGAVLPDVLASFAAYRQRDFVRDYDVEVAQQARIADPTQGAAYAGVFANMTVTRRGDRAFRLALELRVNALPGGVERVPAMSPEIPPLQRTRERSRHHAAQIDVVDGGNVVLDLGVNPFAVGEKGRLFAVVSVTDGG